MHVPSPPAPLAEYKEGARTAEKGCRGRAKGVGAAINVFLFFCLNWRNSSRSGKLT